MDGALSRFIGHYSPDAEILAISCDSKTLSIFHTSNAAEIHAVLYHNFDK